MKDELQTLLIEIIKDLGVTGVTPDVTVSADSKHGEYTSNIALRLAKQLKKPPMDIALQVKNEMETRKNSASHKTYDQKIDKQYQKNAGKTAKADKLQDKDQTPSPFSDVLSAIDRVEIAPPGFVNVFLGDSALSSRASVVLKEAERYGMSQSLVPLDLKGEADGNAKRIMVEFAHPNTHKAFHIGHLRNVTTGESIIRLLESSGHEVIRVNYQGDVGMHIAKCLWCMLHLSEFDPATIRDKDIHVKVEFLGKAYAAGSAKFEEDKQAKKEIGEINKAIYARDTVVFPLYQETRKWSLEYFDSIYQRVGTHYDRLYFESEVYEEGKRLVEQGVTEGVFEKSDGAIIFPGEKVGLHNRVFITKEGNPTYEGKEMGLGKLQFEKNPDLVIHVVGPEQASYFQVVFKALERLFPQTSGREYHKIYGWVKLKHGKMSSRSGQVVLGEWLLDEAKRSIYEILEQSDAKFASSRVTEGNRGISQRYSEEERAEIAEKGAIAAVKYAFLKVSTSQEIAFDIKESVSFDGDSGPYILYTYARCKSVLRKSTSVIASGSEAISQIKGIAASTTASGLAMTMNAEEHELARLIYFFPEVVADAAGELAPNVLCTYLFTLAQTFNLFYQKNPILDAQDATPWRLTLTEATSLVLKNGLNLLGIATVERM